MGLFTKKVTINTNTKGLFDTNVPDNFYVVTSKKQAEFCSAGLLKIAYDSANLVNTTKVPEVFFERYHLLIDKLENLSKLECFKCFKGKLPSKNLQEINNNKVETINNFIDRYYNAILDKIKTLKTEKAKEKCVESFYKELSIYDDFMLQENIQKLSSVQKNKFAFL